MSGPKYSEAELRKIEEQRLEQERRRKLEALRIKRQQLSDRMLHKRNELNKIKHKIEQYLHQFSEEQEIYEITSCKNILSDIMQQDFSVSGTIDELEEKVLSSDRLLEKVRKAQRALEHKVKENKFVESICNVEIEKEKQYFNISFECEPSYSEYENLLQNVNQDIENILLKDRKILLNIKNKLINALKSENVKKPLLKQYKDNYESVLFNAQKEYDRYKNAYIEYCICKETLEEEPNSFEEMEARGSLELLENEIICLRNKIQEKDKLQYISHNIQEVLQEMGHQIIASDFFVSNGNGTYKNSYEYGNDGILNVYHSQNGAVMMEVAILGDGEEISEKEKRHSVELMTSLCSQYPDIIEELEKRGVLLKRTAEMPPDDAYAKKVETKQIFSKMDNKQEIQKQRVRKRKQINDKEYQNL